MNQAPLAPRPLRANIPVARPAGPILDVIPANALPPQPPILEAIQEGPLLEVLPITDAGPDLPEVQPFAPPRFLKNPLGWLLYVIGVTASWLFGVASLIFGLAVLAALPVAQFCALGYLLEVAGRISRTGRIRDGFIGIGKASRVGSLVLGTALALAPLYLVSAFAVSAALINPDSAAVRAWQFGLTALTVVIVLHIVGAWSRGGRLHHFLWPSGNPLRLLRRFFQGERLDVLGLVFLGNFWWLGRRLSHGGYYAEARDAVWDFVMSLRLPYYFWLGLRGFVGALLWVALPVSLIALGRLGPLIQFRGEVGQGLLLGLTVLLGWLLTSFVLLYVPFLQIHLARENRFKAMFELGAARAAYQRAPVAFFVTFFLTLALALPLYFLRIEQVPGDAGWALALFFIATIFPTRLLTGWAYGRAMRRETPRHWFFRWTCRPLMLLTAAIYVFFVFFTQYTSGEGVWSLYGQHAFMLPVPFFAFD